MKILLLGANGQIGYELQRYLISLGKLTISNSKILNFLDIENLQNTILDYNPEIIINAAAYTDVDKAEKEFTKAYDINVNAKRVEYSQLAIPTAAAGSQSGRCNNLRRCGCVGRQTRPLACPRRRGLPPSLR